MKDKKFLVCIASHYNEDRGIYLKQVIGNLLSYDIDIHIIIDTNTIPEQDNYLDWPDTRVEVCEHTNLEHPFYLTWCHRRHIKDNIDNYDYFAFFEDDMLLPYKNFLNYLENFEILWKSGRVPAMIRIEEFNGEQFVTDIIEPQTSIHVQIDFTHDPFRKYWDLKAPNNYNAFWIMPQQALKESLLSNFERLHESREHAASYVAWELQKPTMIQIENGVVSEKCYSYHLPSNYAKSPESKHGKIKPQNIFL